MKILIWIGCFLLSVLVNIIFDAMLKPFGLRLGYGLRYCLYAFITVPLAVSLCRKTDWKRGQKRSESIPVSCYRDAEEYRGRAVELNAYIRSCVKSKKITKKQAKYLYEEFSQKKDI